MLIPPGSESHSYGPTPQDMIKVQNCDVFIYVGGESDKWINKVLGSMGTGKMKIVTLMDCAALVEEEIVEGMEGKESAHISVISILTATSDSITAGITNPAGYL